MSKSLGWESALRIGILRVLLCLIRHWESPQSQGDIRPGYATRLSRVIPATELVHADPGRPLSLSEAAAACGLSRSRFTAAFRQTMGMSFAAFRLRTRLAYAARRLLTTEDTVARIAAGAGFVDASHLHRAFVKHYGRTPPPLPRAARLRPRRRARGSRCKEATRRASKMRSLPNSRQTSDRERRTWTSAVSPSWR